MDCCGPPSTSNERSAVYSDHQRHPTANVALSDTWRGENCVAAKYRVFWDKSAILCEKVSYAKLHRYNQTYRYPKLNGYKHNDKISFRD